MANTLNIFRNGAVGFIDWLGHSENNDACSKEAECGHEEMHRDAGPEHERLFASVIKNTGVRHENNTITNAKPCTD